jgi:hypothetical protein
VFIILEQSHTEVKHKALSMTESIFKTGMDEAPSVTISDFEKEIPLSFPSEETSLGSGLPSHLLMGGVPCTHGALLTAISTTLHSIQQFDKRLRGF